MSNGTPKIPTDRTPGVLQGQPTNTNIALASNFRLVIPKVRLGVYFCTEVTFPDMTCEAIKLTPSIPVMGSVKFFGNKIAHGDMSVKFMVNEDYSNYTQMSDWFKATMVMSDFLPGNMDTGINVVSNVGHLLILSNKKNPIAKFQLNGLMITGLSSIDYNSALTDATATTATATFQFSTYDLEPYING